MPYAVLLIGLLSLLSGGILRISARPLSWPDVAVYSGDPSDTAFGARQAALEDISLFMMILGTGLLLLAVQRLLVREKVRPPSSH